MAQYSPTFDGDALIGSMNVHDFLLWSVESRQLSENSLRLPPVQRSSLWTPRQILDLWDSLLRGLPIGCFYLIEAEAGEDCRTIDPSAKMEPSLIRGYDLLDGQQRMRAMLLAVSKPITEGRCLWVDLENLDDDKVFTLHLTSVSQPFGYDHETGQKLPLQDRSKARMKFDEENKERPYKMADHCLFNEHIERHGFPPKPYKAERAIPFISVFEAWQEGRSEFADYMREKTGETNALVEPQVLTDRIFDGLQMFDASEIALIRVKPSIYRENSINLLKLFDRIGAGGTPLVGEERLYSIYKYYEPYVHNAIEDIHKRVGRVLPSTRIASCALRIASVETRTNSFDIPDVNLFAKEMASDAGVINELRSLIPKASSELEQRGRLSQIFEFLYGALDYTGGEDYGLPRVMIADLSHELIHVIAYWIYLHVKKENDITSASRQELVRFILFWHLCCFNDYKAS